MGVRKVQNSFTGGEISPRLEGRTDLKQYGNSVAELENFFPHSYGGIAKAPGLYFVCETKDSTKESRLIEFERKIGQTYVIEVGDYYMRFVRDGAQITLSSTPDAYAAGTTYEIGDLVSDVGINYYSKVDSNLGNTPATSPSHWHALTDDIYEISTPFSESEIWDINFCQSVDVMWLTHQDHNPVRLSRYSETNWVINDEVFFDGPFQSINPTTTKMVASAGSGSVTVTADATNGINGGAGFLATDIGRQIRLFNNVPDPQEWAWLTITAVTDTTHVTATVEDGDAPTVATDNWRLGAFSETTGWPATVMFFEQRLCYAGTVIEPQGIWLSQTDAFNVFTVSYPVVDSDACSFVLAADKVNDIAWMMSSRELAIGTTGGEWNLSGAEGKVISPTSVKAKRYTTSGGSVIRPVAVGSAVLFVDRTQKELLELAYVFEDDGYNSPDMLLLADHITRNRKIVDIAWQGQKISKLYCVMDDGILGVLTYKRAQDVIGWSRRSSQGLFESAAAVSSSYRDVPYFIVNRTINTVTKRFIEWMKSDFGDDVEPNVIFAGSVPSEIPDMIVYVQIGNSPRQVRPYEFDYAMDDAEYNPASPTDPQLDYGDSPVSMVNRSNADNDHACGQIGDKLYVYWEDTFPTPDVPYITEYDMFTEAFADRVIDLDTTNGEKIIGTAIGQQSSTDLTPTLAICFWNPITSDYDIQKATYNTGTDIWEVDTGTTFSIRADSLPAAEADNAIFSANNFSGAARLGMNSTHIFIPIRNCRNSGIDPQQSKILILHRSTLEYSGVYDVLQSGMKDSTPPNSPKIAVFATDYFICTVFENSRDTYPSTPDKFYIEVRDAETFIVLDTYEFDSSGQVLGAPWDVIVFTDKILITYAQDKSTPSYPTILKLEIDGAGQITFLKEYLSGEHYNWSLNEGYAAWWISADDRYNYK